jgi:hypothetical protein
MTIAGEGRMIDHIRGLYFSNHHLTRDLLANVAPFTAFVCLLVIAFSPLQSVAIYLFKEYLLEASAWTFTLALIIYLTGGWFIGTIAAFGGTFLQRLWSRVPRFGNECSYTYWYNKDQGDINALYSKLFPDYEYLSSGAAVTPTDKVNTR